MSASQVYADTPALAAGGLVYNNLCIKGSQSSICLLYAGKASAAGVATLAFVVPGSVATDLVFYCKESSATAASVIVGAALSNAGLVNATWTLTLSAAENYTASIAVYRAV